MKYKGEAALKDGTELVLCSLREADAQQVLALCRKTAGETRNLIRHEHEWTMTPEQEGEAIRHAQYGPKSLMLGAFVDGKLVGMGSIMPPAGVDRARHRANLGVLVLKSHWGMGVGTALLRVLIEQAKTTALEQLELEVVSTNERAIRLYERFGFAEFARHPRKLKYRDGSYADMVLMMLELRRDK